MSQLLPDLLSESAERFPDKVALAFRDERLTFAALSQKSGKVAARLRHLGVGVGDRVAILHENTPPALVFFWGVLQRGAVSVDVPSLASTNAVASILEECRPRVLAVSARQLRRVAREGIGDLLPDTLLVDEEPVDLAPRPAAHVHELAEIESSEDEDPPSPAVDASEVAMVVYTSGSTGAPKGVQLSHENLISNLRASNERMRLGSDDSVLVVVPLSFIHGRMQILLHAWLGGTVAVSAGFRYPQQVVRELLQHRVTGFSGVPYHFATLIERGGLATTPLPDLRYVLVTGGALTPSMLGHVRAALPGVAVHVAYGLTEASPRVTHLGPDEVDSRPGSSGRPLPGVQVEILDDDGARVPTGDVGEIVVTGPNVMRGYVSGAAPASPRVDEEGRLHTGDLGRLTADGHLYLAGRKSDMIKTAGERVFPREIEDVIATHPRIEECAVAGAPDPMLGERLVALVVPKPGAELEANDVLSHCLRVLPFVRTPREVRMVEALPKTESGKLDRSAAKALAREEPGPRQTEDAS
jgi:long-chain acyl-CoA synthetase